MFHARTICIELKLTGLFLSFWTFGLQESYRRKYGDIQGYSYIGTIGQGNFGKVLLAENDITGEKVKTGLDLSAFPPPSSCAPLD